MSFVATAIIGGISAAGAIGGGLIASSGAKSAAKTQAQSAADASAIEKQMFEENRADLAPWRETGVLSLDRLKSLLGLSGDTNAEGYGSLTQGYAPFDEKFTAPNMIDDPGYQARIAEGQKGIERSSAAKTGTLNGAAAKEMARYSQDYASNEYGNTYNRALSKYNTDLNAYTTNYGVDSANKTNLFNRLSSLAGLGQQSATTTAQLGANTANQIGQNTIGAGNATAAGQVGSANAWSNAISGVSNNLSNMLMMQQLMKNSGYGSTSSGPYSV
jgi:hypothetical protein